MLPHPYAFISNDADDLHCFQATLRMAWEGLFGEKLSPARADALSEYVEGAQTWPFAGMLALADRGAVVTNVEDFDPETFTDDPATEILRQCDGDKELAERILSVADADSQKPLVRRILDHPRMTFKQSAPTMAHLQATATTPDTALICNVNYRALVGREGWNGHFVLIVKVTPDQVIVQDPGLPPLENYAVDHDTFIKAWTTPNMIVVSLPHDSKSLPTD